ncbi:MAG: mannose-1-phosphate guanylyltransferase [Phycisphaerae bacterium]
MRHAVIMAGGAGQRLWPLSRSVRPKQLLKLVDGKSLLRQAYMRVANLLPADSIYVITNRDHLGLIAEDLPELPPENLFGEPVGRDTANAVGLSAAILKQRDPEAVIGIFTADHIITPMDRFVTAVGTAYDMALDRPGALGTLGIRPTRPETGYGYVQRGAPIADGVYQVRRFAEKPDADMAKRYLASGDYSWNSGMFTWTADAILGQLAQHLPESHEGVTRIAEVWDTARRDEVLDSVYPTLPKISIDFAVMEKAPGVFVVEMDCSWVDVGSWAALEEVTDHDADGNVLGAARTVTLDAGGNVLVSEDEHLIAAFGVQDLVIVHAADATLVCRKQDAQALKKLVSRLNDVHPGKYV